MSAPASFVNGLMNGIQTGQQIIDTRDASEKRKRDEALTLELYQQQQSDRLRAQKIEDESLAFARSDHERQVKRQETIDLQTADQLAKDNAYKERQLRLQELTASQQARLNNARADNNLTQQQVAQMELDAMKQNELAKEAQRLGGQASELFKQGNIEQGLAVYSELDALGFGTKDVIDGKYTTMEAEDVIGKVLSGEKSIEDPDFRKLASKLMMPSFLASGRDPEKYEPAGLRESRPGFFAVELKDKETGKLVPATDRRSPHADDPIIEISKEELMAGATSWLEGAREAEMARDALEAQQQINSVAARFMADRVSTGKSKDDGKADPLPVNQQAFIDLQVGDGMKNMAKLLIAEDGYDQTLPDKLARITDISAGKGDSGEKMSLSEALIEYREEVGIDQVVAKRMTELSSRGVDAGKAERLVRRAVREGWDRAKYDEEVKKLTDKPAKEPESSKAPVQQKDAPAPAPLSSMRQYGSDRTQ